MKKEKTKLKTPTTQKKNLKNIFPPKKFSKKSAFTLAEILIALVLIGILTAILLPVAFHAAPDEDVMKFKKANNTLATIIKELVTSDKYYKDGDLGIRANGELIDGEHEGDIEYFCRTFSELLNTKSVNCSDYKDGILGHACSDWDGMEIEIDRHCKAAANAKGKDLEEIVTPDGIIYFQASPASVYHYKGNLYDSTTPSIATSTEEKEYGEGAFYTKDSNGFLRCAKVFCIDIDAIDGGEDPFGYGIRVDGKIYPGKRALEWMEKSVQKGNE